MRELHVYLVFAFCFMFLFAFQTSDVFLFFPRLASHTAKLKNVTEPCPTFLSQALWHFLQACALRCDSAGFTLLYMQPYDIFPSSFTLPSEQKKITSCPQPGRLTTPNERGPDSNKRGRETTVAQGEGTAAAGRLKHGSRAAAAYMLYVA